jgi:hypothetical protein
MPAANAAAGQEAPLLIKGFDCLTPESFANQEPLPKNYGQGVDYPFIEAEGSLPFVDLPAKLLELIKHCWKSSSVSAGAGRTRLQIGTGRRVNHMPNKLNRVARSWKPDDVFEASRLRAAAAPYVKQQVGPLAWPDIASDWKLTEQVERVSAYTFRGDKRDPQAIEAVGGFHPPVTRNDRYYVDNVICPKFQEYMKRRFNREVSGEQFQRVYGKVVGLPDDRAVLRHYLVWRDLVETESHHLGRMLGDETLKNYISTSKVLNSARIFAIKSSTEGWVYVTRVRGGFHITKKKGWPGVYTYEQEIAFPGSLLWEDVFGFRKAHPSRQMYTGPIYLRKGFEASNPTAFREVFELLSGKHQRYE